MLPFLKNRQDAIMNGPDDEIIRKSDDEDDYDMLDAIAEDLLAAVNKKDSKLIKDALLSLVDHIKSEDEEQDEQTFGAEQ